MSDRSYIVIFEYTKVTGGYYKCRTRTDYLDKAEFRASYKTIPQEIVVAEGINEEEAERLLYSVPAVCLYTASVEKLFETPGVELTLFHLQIVIAGTNLAAKHASERRFELGIINTIDADFRSHLIDLQCDRTPKGPYFRHVIGKYRPEFDYMPPLHFLGVL
jgi:hypothetical protein